MADEPVLDDAVIAGETAAVDSDEAVAGSAADEDLAEDDLDVPVADGEPSAEDALAPQADGAEPVGEPEEAQ